MWIEDWYPRFSFALVGMHTHGYVSSHEHAHICTKELLTEETELRKGRCAQPPARASLSTEAVTGETEEHRKERCAQPPGRASAGRQWCGPQSAGSVVRTLWTVSQVPFHL